MVNKDLIWKEGQGLEGGLVGFDLKGLQHWYLSNNKIENLLGPLRMCRSDVLLQCYDAADLK